MPKINKKNLNRCYSKWSQYYNDNAKRNRAIIKDRPIMVELLKTNINPKSVGLDLGCGTDILTVTPSDLKIWNNPLCPTSNF